MCRLALQLGIDEPDRWLAQHTASTLVTWFRYYELEPFGPKVVPFQLAALRAMFANYVRKKGVAPHRIEEFLWGYQAPARAQTPEEMFELLKAFGE